MIELPPELICLTRAWLLAHGWEQANRIPLFQHDPEIIDADLCVIVDRKMYMIAKFHYMGDKAFEPSAMPDSFDVVGVNNNAELLEYDHTRLVLAAFVCHLTGFEVIDHHAEAMLRLPCVRSAVKVGKGTGGDDYDIAYIVETEGKMKFAYRGDVLMEEYGEWYLSPQKTTENEE